jgi:hypothetical protein
MFVSIVGVIIVEKFVIVLTNSLITTRLLVVMLFAVILLIFDMSAPPPFKPPGKTGYNDQSAKELMLDVVAIGIPLRSSSVAFAVIT